MALLDTVKGWFDGGKSKVQDTVATHADSIKGGIDKAGSVVDDKTGGKYSDKVTAAREKSKGLVDGLAGDKPATEPDAGGSPPDAGGAPPEAGGAPPEAGGAPEPGATSGPDVPGEPPPA